MSISIDEKVFKHIMGCIDEAQTYIESQIARFDQDDGLDEMRDMLVRLRNEFRQEFTTMKPSAVLGVTAAPVDLPDDVQLMGRVQLMDELKRYGAVEGELRGKVVKELREMLATHQATGDEPAPAKKAPPKIGKLVPSHKPVTAVKPVVGKPVGKLLGRKL